MKHTSQSGDIRTAILRITILLEGTLRRAGKSKQYFNKDGMLIYLEIRNKWIEIDDKWH